MSDKTISTHWPLTIVSALSSLVNIFIPIILVRILSANDIGEYKIFFLYLSLAPALTLSFGLQSNIPYFNRLKEDSLDKIQACFQLLLLGAAGFSIIIYFNSFLLENIFQWNSKVATLFTLAIFGSIAHLLFEDCLVAQEKVKFAALISGVFESVKSIAVLSASIYFRNVESVLLAYVLVVNLKAVFSVLYAFKLKFISLKFNLNSTLSVLKLAAPVSIAAFLAICVDKADQLILSTRLSPESFALYSIGCLIIPPLYALEISVMRVSIPRMATLLANSDRAGCIRLHYAACKQLAIFLIPATTALIIFAEPIINLLFTVQYSEASIYLKIFALTYFLLSFPSDCIARAKADSKWILRTALLFSCLSLVFTFICTNIWSALGALISTIIIKAIYKLYCLRYSCRSLKCNLKDLIPVSLYITAVLISAVLISLSLFCTLVLNFSLIELIFVLFSVLLFFYSLLIIKNSNSQVQRCQEIRILMLVQNLKIGGLERLVVSLANQLSSKENLRIHILAYDCSEIINQQNFEGLIADSKVVYHKLSKPARFSFKTIFEICIYIFRNRIDLIHSHNIGPFLYSCLCSLCLLGTVKVVHTNHGFVDLDSNPKYKAYERIFSIFASKIICVSTQVFNVYLKLGVRKNKLTVINNAVSLNSSLLEPLKASKQVKLELAKSTGINQLEAKADYLWVLYMARIHSVKGQDIAIRAWSDFQQKFNAKAILIFVGPDSDPLYSAEIKILAKHLDHNDSIIFAGPTVDTFRWHSCSDLFLCLSRSEGLPLAPLEAMLALRPTILSNIEGHKIFSEHSQLVAINDSAELADQLSLFIANIDMYSDSKLKQARSWVQNNFSFEKMSSEYLSIYLKTLKI